MDMADPKYIIPLFYRIYKILLMCQSVYLNFDLRKLLATDLLGTCQKSKIG